MLALLHFFSLEPRFNRVTTALVVDRPSTLPALYWNQGNRGFFIEHLLRAGGRGGVLQGQIQEGLQGGSGRQTLWVGRGLA